MYVCIQNLEDFTLKKELGKPQKLYF
jgi:hypothetical protein